MPRDRRKGGESADTQAAVAILDDRVETRHLSEIDDTARHDQVFLHEIDKIDPARL